MRNELVLEIGIKLDKNLEYYQEMLLEQGARNVYNCITYDIYWSNKNFDGMSENEIKRSCVRFRYSECFGGELWNGEFFPKSGFQNYKIFDNLAEDNFGCPIDAIDEFEEKFKHYGFKRVFDTKKVDYQYVIGDMKSRIQLQDIEGVGLLLYYDNPDFYHLSLKKQRKKLIDEINSYGFSIKYSTLGLDKLRTLYYKKECFSLNQNG